ncbi:MAG TPA: metal-dependent transcriptional regulator [Candidatus Eisenbacteria bacterium]|jgi:DtxR family Mn-dependent transcriptional regulator
MLTLKHELTRSRQDYLKALYTLGPGGQSVATSKLARQLAVSAPSVTNMLGKLAIERLVAYTPRGGAQLTRQGRRLALDMVRRHRILETFLVRVLGLDWAEVHEDAEILEHHISEKVLAAIDRLVGHPVEDPHGHPIPDSSGRMVRRSLTSLALLERGARATVREIRGVHDARLSRWKELGLVPGARIRVREVRTVDGVIDLEVGGGTHTVGREGLEGLYVEVERE